MHRNMAAAAIVAVLAAVPAHAQTVNTMLPVPPLPQIGLPLPHIGLPPPDELPGRSRTPAPAPDAVRHGRPHRADRQIPAVIVVAPYIIERLSAPAPTREGPAKAVETRPVERPAADVPAAAPAVPEPAAVLPAAPPAPRIGKVYIIPGCYAGNVPPAQVSLPKGCDPSAATLLDR